MIESRVDQVRGQLSLQKSFPGPRSIQFPNLHHLVFEWRSYDSYERGSEMSEWWQYVEIAPISNKAAVSAMVYALEIPKVGPFILGAVS